MKSDRQASYKSSGSSRVPPSNERPAIIDLFVSICKRWKIEESDQLILLGYKDNPKDGTEILAGTSGSLSRDTEDRAGHVAGISLGLSTLFGDNFDAESAWLQLPRKQLDHQCAIDHMLQGDMVNLIVVSDMVLRERGF